MKEMDTSYENSNAKKCWLAMFCGKTSLFILMTGYAFFGALLFKFLEGGEENYQVADFQRSREDCLKELWIITDFSVDISENQSKGSRNESPIQSMVENVIPVFTTSYN